MILSELSNNELLVLNNILGYNLDFEGCEGSTVNEILNKIENSEDCNGTEMNNAETKAFINAARKCIERNPSLGEYKMVDCSDKSIANTATFSDGDDAVVVFWGTTGEKEWYDNVKVAGDYFIKNDADDGEIGSVYQEEASEYIREISEKFGYKNITVTGHSKGGNKAQYVTLVSDNIDRCVVFDGQGFSKDFVEAYKDIIDQKKSIITNISAEKDIVNGLLVNIAGTKLYVDTSKVPEEYIQNFFHYHKPNILLDPNGELYNTDGVEPSQLTCFINEYTVYLSSIEDDEQREKAIEFAAQIASKAMVIMNLDSDEEKNQATKELMALLKNTDNTEAISVFVAYTFEFAEENNLQYKEVLEMLSPIVDTSAFDTWHGELLWEALFDASKNISADEFIDLCLQVKEWADSKELSTWDEFLAYIKEDPIRIIDLYASLDLSKETVNQAIKDFLSDENISKLIANLAADYPEAYGVITDLMENPITRSWIEAVGGIAVVLTVTALIANHINVQIEAIKQDVKIAIEYIGRQVGKAIDYISEKIAEGIDYVEDKVEQAVDYIQDKVSEFYNELKNTVRSGLNSALAKVYSEAEKIVTKGSRFINSAVDTAGRILSAAKRVSVAAIDAVLKYTQPFFYSIASKVYRLRQGEVTINLVKLKRCVNTLYRLASRISALDSRLDSLYYRLSKNNIEQQEGVFTSLASMYNLFRADLNIDEGASIRRKANALSELLEGFENVERKIINNAPKKI